MTAQLAIPATTVVLRTIVQRRIGLAYAGLTAPTVSVEPPPRPPASPANGMAAAAQPEPAGLYLFLHHVVPNAAWRNYEPRPDGIGRQGGPSPLAVDLHYLLAATGAGLEREVLLGLGITALNRHGIISRPLIRSILGAISVADPSAPILDGLATEPLHDPAVQPERITVAQAPVDVDLSTKIWSALQSPMRPCAHFLVTTVFLDIGETPPEAAEVTKVKVGVRPDAEPSFTLPPDDTVTAAGGG
ncbi:hypothetical protein AQJ23_17285 [Streptomyces antibioticus]|nr:DUF4255 domain-containing protein [Streptomyces antibioticus]KUN25119.1 hypothetical protein AQJ23_17285 [Streptomyces antibioticus]